MTAFHCFAKIAIFLNLCVSAFNLKLNVNVNVNHRQSIATRTQHNMHSSSQVVATILLSLTPFGNIQEALKSTLADSNAVLCTLDTQQSDEYHDSCQLLPNVVRYRANRLLTFRQDWGGSESTGAAIWNGANIASKYLESTHELNGKSVIALGEGVGFEGIIANLLGAREVAITDGNEAVLKLADENIRINIDDPMNSNRKIYTSRLRWNTEDEKSFLEKQWDYILASDVTYLKKNRHDLLTCIAHLSTPTTITYLAMEPRSPDEVKDTMKEATEVGLSWKEIPSQVDKIKSQCNMECGRIFSLQKIQ